MTIIIFLSLTCILVSYILEVVPALMNSMDSLLLQEKMKMLKARDSLKFSQIHKYYIKVNKPEELICLLTNKYIICFIYLSYYIKF